MDFLSAAARVLGNTWYNGAPMTVMTSGTSQILSAERANDGTGPFSIIAVRIGNSFDFGNDAHTAALLRQLRSAHNLFSDEKEMKP